MSKVLEKQVGGSHYKGMPFQPVELFAKTHCTAFQANIWKYISRYKNKNGKQDVEKCIHYAELAEELNANGHLSKEQMLAVREFCEVNRLSRRQTRIVIMAALDRYRAVTKYCRALLQKEYPGDL